MVTNLHDTVYRVTSQERQLRTWASVVLVGLLLVVGFYLGRDLRRTQKIAAVAQEKADLEALRSELIVASSPYALLMCSEQGWIVKSNLAAEILVGWKHEDLIGRSATVL